MKRIAALIWVLAVGLLLTGADQAPVVHSNNFYVNDYAAVLSDSHRSDMLALARDLKDKTGTEVVVLTVASMNGRDIEDYGRAVINGWNIGNRGQNGALILVSMADEASMVFLGDSFHSLLDKYRKVEIEIASTNLSDSVMQVFRSLVKDAYSLGGVEPSSAMRRLLGERSDKSEGPFTPTTIVLIAGVFLVLGRSMRVSRKYRQKYLKGNVRKVKSHIRNFDEEDVYNNEKLYQIKYDDED